MRYLLFFVTTISFICTSALADTPVKMMQVQQKLENLEKSFDDCFHS